jgi:hypothetical protein
METSETPKDKPWRPGDHPRPGPSWDEVKTAPPAEAEGGSNAQD